MTSDYDPNVEPETQEEADRYINWCAECLTRLSEQPSTYRTGVRCAAWLFVVATAQLHLDDDHEENREALLEQLANYQGLGRAIERQREHYVAERLIVLRASLDCWEPMGEWAGHLLEAAKCAVAALLLIELHPLVDLWDLPAPDVWAAIETGIRLLSEINLSDVDGLEFADFAIRPDDMVTAKFTWQRINGIVRRVGAQPLSPN